MTTVDGYRPLQLGWAGSAPIGAEEFPRFWQEASPGERAEVTGHFAMCWEDQGRHWLVRDPLGVHKLFFGVAEERVVASRYAHEVVAAGIPFERIHSVPSGHFVVLDPHTRAYALEQYVALPYGDPDAPMSDLEGHAERVRGALDGVFARLARALRGRDVVVTLSGGLDSSTIAAMAREHLGGARTLRAITFTTPDASPSAQSDLHFARMVAEHLGLPLDVVEVSPERIPSFVDEVLRNGQDFRDFNVHCGLVNAALAEHLAREHSRAGNPGGAPVVLTGDAMNELVADYAPVEYEGERFYDLPRMSQGRLRRFLVLGLDSGDREIGIYGGRGIDCVQPYTLCASAYTQLPGGFLTSSGAKRELVARVMGARIPAPVYERPKVRAQVGSGEQVGGTLAAMVRAGRGARALLARFAELFGIAPEAAEREARAFIRGGLYRFTNEFPGQPEQKATHVPRDR